MKMDDSIPGPFKRAPLSLQLGPPGAPGSWVGIPKFDRPPHAAFAQPKAAILTRAPDRPLILPRNRRCSAASRHFMSRLCEARADSSTRNKKDPLTACKPQTRQQGIIAYKTDRPDALATRRLWASSTSARLSFPTKLGPA